ncbi:ABC transporter ATP-binding protein [Rhodoligotrophos ferricapiens]|uniref:ABC transporter ATP-binding protein n=1 Tax=Rhodoligotrophos ferricapiens TaxID=3069264 RepID=UPI00315D0AEB
MSTFSVSIAHARYGKLVVLDAVEFSVEPGEMLVVLGSNGAGKSTTLRALIGTVACARRELTLRGERLDRLPSWQLPLRGISLVPDGARCFPNLSVMDNLIGPYVATHSGRAGKPKGELLEHVFALFPVLHARSESAAGTLSGGQRQMLAVGRALMTEPNVLLLDEPSAGLAPKIVEDLFTALARIKAEQECAIVMAEQSVGYATKVADRCLVLEEGHVALSGPMDTVTKDERLRTAYLGL